MVGTEVVIDISNGLVIVRPNDCLILLLIVHASVLDIAYFSSEINLSLDCFESSQRPPKDHRSSLFSFPS